MGRPVQIDVFSDVFSDVKISREDDCLIDDGRLLYKVGTAKANACPLSLCTRWGVGPGQRT